MTRQEGWELVLRRVITRLHGGTGTDQTLVADLVRLADAMARDEDIGIDVRPPAPTPPIYTGMSYYCWRCNCDVPPEHVCSWDPGAAHL